MFTLYLVEDRVTKTKTLVVSDKRFSSFVGDLEDRKSKNVEELQSSPDLPYLQSRLPHYLKTYKLDESSIVNPHGVKISREDKKRLRIPRKKREITDEERKKRSESKKGDKNPMFGKKQSQRSNAINSMKRRQRLIQPHAQPHREESKDKYRESRKKWKPNTGKRWSYDPYTFEEKLVDDKNPLPPGWFYGRSPAFLELLHNKRKKQ